MKDITAVHLGQDEAFAEDPLGFFPVGAAVALDHHVDVEEIHGGILRVDEEAGALIHPDHDGDEITVWVDGVGRKLFPFGCGEFVVFQQRQGGVGRDLVVALADLKTAIPGFFDGGGQFVQLKGLEDVVHRIQTDGVFQVFLIGVAAQEENLCTGAAGLQFRDQ